MERISCWLLVTSGAHGCCFVIMDGIYSTTHSSSSELTPPAPTTYRVRTQDVDNGAASLIFVQLLYLK